MIFMLDTPGYTVYYLFLCSIGLLISAAAFLLLNRPHLRRDGYHRWGKVSRPVALAIAISIFVPFVAYAQAECGGHFFGVSKTHDTLVLHYYFPKRTVTIPAAESTSISVTSEIRKGIHYRLVIQTPTETHTSQLLTQRQADQYRAALSNPPQ